MQARAQTAPPGQGLVGRERERGQLRGALDGALAGQGRLVVITGEAGMGKTRLAEDLAARARAQSAEVLWGRCWEAGGAPAFWPWVEVLRGWVRAPDTGARAVTGPVARRLARLVPELAPGEADPTAVAEVSDTERFLLFDAVAEALASAAGQRPLVVVLDDLHAADHDSLLLLRFAARTVRESAILLVGAWRDRELGLAPHSRELLDGLAGEGEVMRLHGLTEHDVRRLVAGHTGVEPSPEAARALCEATDGNPLFLTEAARLLAAEDAARPDQLASRPLAIPPRLRAVIARRLQTVPTPTSEALTTAAVIGREFSVGLLAGLQGMPAVELLRVLEPALTAQLLEPAPTGAGRLRFAHVLVRDAIYAELTPGRRVELHRGVGDALEVLATDDAGEHLSELAHHFLQAATDRPSAELAAEYAERAAERALRMLAFEQATSAYGSALVAGDLAKIGPARRCSLLLRLGDAHWRAGAGGAARASFGRAAELADATGDAELLARAALGFGEIGVAAGAVDHELVALLERALAALPEHDGSSRARVLGRLARELHFAHLPARRAQLSQAAVEMARRLDDPATLAFALGAWHIAEWAPGNPEERLAVATEVCGLAERSGAAALCFQAHVWRVADLLSLGDVPGVDTEIEVCDHLARSLRQPAWSAQVAMLRGMRALLAGAFADADRLAREALRLGRPVRGPTATTYFVVQELARRHECGGLEELEPRVRRLAEEEPKRWLADYAFLLAGLEREADCRAVLERLAAEGLAVDEEDIVTLLMLTQAAEAACFLGDRERARQIYDRLAPHATRWVVSGLGGACYGCVARPLGLLTHTLGRLDEAERHFEVALRAHETAGARVWVARTQHEYARLLGDRAGPGDAERARVLSGAARTTAEALGMVPLLAHLDSVDRGPEPGRQAAIRREGEYWALTWNARTVLVRDSKGLRHLARLLASPQVEISAVELVRGTAASRADGPAPAADGLAVRAAGQDDAGELLDAQARRAYRQRADELREELDEARAMRDPERVERARAELDFLAAELSRAVGLGGRVRRAGSTSERARLNATRALRGAIERITEQHPELGVHLQEAVRTGLACRYAPDTLDAVTWEVAD